MFTYWGDYFDKNFVGFWSESIINLSIGLKMVMMSHLCCYDVRAADAVAGLVKCHWVLNKSSCSRATEYRTVHRSSSKWRTTSAHQLIACHGLDQLVLVTCFLYTLLLIYFRSNVICVVRLSKFPWYLDTTKKWSALYTNREVCLWR